MEKVNEQCPQKKRATGPGPRRTERPSGARGNRQNRWELAYATDLTSLVCQATAKTGPSPFPDESLDKEITLLEKELIAAMEQFLCRLKETR